ncbi:MAG: 2-hydroxychromene-2-carboxylate isomerase [Pseudomonadota bacterium]
MSVTVEFYYDVASPNAYLSNKVLSDILDRTGASVVYRPVLLGGVFKATNNQAPWITFAPVKAKMAYNMLEMDRFIKKHELTDYKFNPHFPLNTLMLSRGAVAAEMNDELEAYIAAGEKLVWEQGLKMDDPDVFIEGFTAEGLDGAKLAAQTQDQAVKDQLIANTNAAVERGIFGIPTFFVGDEMFFGKDRLRDLEEEILAQSA